MKISFIIPCYNCEHTIGSVVTEIITLMTKHPQDQAEIILVNDASSDQTSQVLAKLAQTHSSVKVINLTRNFGQHAAIMAGLNHCRGGVVVCLDDDGQTPAAETYLLLDQLAAGYDVVFAQYQHKKHALWRNFGSWLNQAMAKSLLGKQENIYLSSFFATKKFIVQEIIKYTNPYPYLAGLLLRSSNNVTNVTVKHRPRLAGQSTYSLSKLISLWLNGFTAFSVKPLRIATLCGCIFAIVGFIYATYLIIAKLTDPERVLGYTSMMAALLIIGGMLMLMLGLIGEYLGRIYISLNKSPQYVIKTIDERVGVGKRINLTVGNVDSNNTNNGDYS
jgi:undecaprenyl-phosphate 4-deoxy-4-formamido-L-arabinose transferase